MSCAQFCVYDTEDEWWTDHKKEKAARKAAIEAEKTTRLKDKDAEAAHYFDGSDASSWRSKLAETEGRLKEEDAEVAHHFDGSDAAGWLSKLT